MQVRLLPKEVEGWSSSKDKTRLPTSKLVEIYEEAARIIREIPFTVDDLKVSRLIKKAYFEDKIFESTGLEAESYHINDIRKQPAEVQ